MIERWLLVGALALTSGCLPRVAVMPEPARVVIAPPRGSHGPHVEAAHTSSHVALDWRAPDPMVPPSPYDAGLTPTESLDELRSLLVSNVAPEDFDIPVTLNSAVLKWVEYFLGRGRNSFEVWVARSGRWRPMIEAALLGEGMPKDLAFLPMIESGYNAVAASPASATGMWQLMHSTGRPYLTITSYTDERRDPEKATVAAARHLRYLYERFDDWYLALAAYNAGEGTVSRAVERRDSRDYWELCERGEFWEETRNFVPKLLAAMVLGKAPEAFGLDVTLDQPLVYDVVAVPGGVSLLSIAAAADTDVETVLALNPELKRSFTPPSAELWDVKLPLGAADGFQERFGAQAQGVERTQRIHTVAQGESPAAIARRYGVSVEELLRANKISDTRRIQIGTPLVVPGEIVVVASVAAPAALAPEPSGVSAPREQAPSAAPAQVAAPAAAPLPPAVERAAEPRPPLAATPRSPRTHTVGAGDSLWRIADLYGVSVQALRDANPGEGTSLLPGQVLKLPAAPSRIVVHTVRPGESLWSVARTYRVDVGALQRWNNVQGASIQPGDRLNIRLP